MYYIKNGKKEKYNSHHKDYKYIRVIGRNQNTSKQNVWKYMLVVLAIIVTSWLIYSITRK